MSTSKNRSRWWTKWSRKSRNRRAGWNFLNSRIICRRSGAIWLRKLRSVSKIRNFKSRATMSNKRPRFSRRRSKKLVASSRSWWSKTTSRRQMRRPSIKFWRKSSSIISSRNSRALLQRSRVRAGSFTLNSRACTIFGTRSYKTSSWRMWAMLTSNWNPSSCKSTETSSSHVITWSEIFRSRNSWSTCKERIRSKRWCCSSSRRRLSRTYSNPCRRSRKQLSPHTSWTNSLTRYLKW